MNIAIGTKNPAKLNAITLGIESCLYLEGDNIEIIPESVASDVSDMPLSLEENILGAKNRAKNLKKVWIEADYYVGMEGGTTMIEDKAYLFGVVYIENATGKWHIGISNLLEVPEKIQTRLYNWGEELSTIIDSLSGEENVGHRNGSFWMWSDDMITRSESFQQAFLCAIAPFYNRFYK